MNDTQETPDPPAREKQVNDGEDDAPTPEELENDPARNPDDQRLKDIKGG